MILQAFPFDDDSDIDVVFGDETITLHYEEDLDGLATVSTDRAGAPIGGQVHVTVSDFRLNLDPTGADVWTMHADGTLTSLVADDTNGNWLDTDDDVDTTTSAFGGLGGKFTVTDKVKIVTVAGGQVTLTETGANTGVFESQNSDDSSNIVVTGDENDDFTIEYADSDVQVFIEDFDSTLEVIADGTWDSGESLTVRLTNENLNTNTLTDQDMAIGDDNLPILMFGEPITLATVEIDAVVDEDNPTLGDRLTIDKDTHVGTLVKTTTFNEANSNYTFTVTLTEAQKERLQDGTLNNYIHYSSDLEAAATNAHLEGTTPDTDLTTTNNPVENRARIVVDSEADGIFNITFTVPAADPTETLLTSDAATANEGILAAVTAANADTVDSVTDLTTGVNGTQASAAFKDEVTTSTAGLSLENAQAEVERIALEHIVTHEFTVIADIFTFGADSNDAIYRALLEETDSASGVFEGTVEYQMLNQRTVNDNATHNSVDAVGNELAMILNTDYTGGDAPEFTYKGDNASEDAPTNTGEVSVDASTYRVSDDVTITLVDADLNTDSGAREIYRIVNSSGDTIEKRVVSIAIGDLSCVSEIKDVSLRETASDSGIFEGSFEVPDACGVDRDNKPILTTGESITVTYEDFRDENGGDSEWTDSATIGADTGSVSLDRTVYPVPTAADTDDNIEATQVTITVAVDDSDVDTSSSSTQTIETDRVTLTVAGVIVDLGST